jgi:protein involved in polysaccharide export with SLBB domain
LQTRSISGALIALCALLAATPAAASTATVHAGDQLFVTVYGHAELSGPVTVNAADLISLPLAGTIDVRGLGTQQVAERVRLALVNYVIKPAVDVQLKAQPDRIFVSGGPGGVLKFQPGETLAAALADLPLGGPQSLSGSSNDGPASDDSRLAAMTSSRIDLRRVGVVRDGKNLGSFDVTAFGAGGESGPTLQPGDTILLVDKPIAVRVNGDVQTPGIAHLWSDEALSDAFTQVGGLKPSAASSHISLTRGGVTQQLALGDPIFARPPEADESLTVPSAPRVVVAGLVDKPGTVTLKTNFSLLSALYAAGGPTTWADLTQVQVIGGDAKATYDIRGLVHGDTSQNPQLKDGDVVFVPEGHKVDSKGIFQTILSGIGALWLLK